MRKSDLVFSIPFFCCFPIHVFRKSYLDEVQKGSAQKSQISNLPKARGFKNANISKEMDYHSKKVTLIGGGMSMV